MPSGKRILRGKTFRLIAGEYEDEHEVGWFIAMRDIDCPDVIDEFLKTPSQPLDDIYPSQVFERFATWLVANEYARPIEEPCETWYLGGYKIDPWFSR